MMGCTTEQEDAVACLRGKLIGTWRGNTHLPLQVEAVPRIVQRLAAGLVPALQSGEETGTLHARRLTTALQACSAALSGPPAGLHSHGRPLLPVLVSLCLCEGI